MAGLQLEGRCPVDCGWWNCEVYRRGGGLWLRFEGYDTDEDQPLETLAHLRFSSILAEDQDCPQLLPGRCVSALKQGPDAGVYVDARVVAKWHGGHAPGAPCNCRFTVEWLDTEDCGQTTSLILDDCSLCLPDPRPLSAHPDYPAWLAVLPEPPQPEDAAAAAAAVAAAASAAVAAGAAGEEGLVQDTAMEEPAAQEPAAAGEEAPASALPSCRWDGAPLRGIVETTSDSQAGAGPSTRAQLRVRLDKAGHVSQEPGSKLRWVRLVRCESAAEAAVAWDIAYIWRMHQQAHDPSETAFDSPNFGYSLYIQDSRLLDRIRGCTTDGHLLDLVIKLHAEGQLHQLAAMAAAAQAAAAAAAQLEAASAAQPEAAAEAAAEAAGPSPGPGPITPRGSIGQQGGGGQGADSGSKGAGSPILNLGQGGWAGAAAGGAGSRGGLGAQPPASPASSGRTISDEGARAGRRVTLSGDAGPSGVPHFQTSAGAGPAGAQEGGAHGESEARQWAGGAVLAAQQVQQQPPQQQEHAARNPAWIFQAMPHIPDASHTLPLPPPSQAPPRPVHNGWPGCACRTSKCQHATCACLAAGRGCGPQCICLGCANRGLAPAKQAWGVPFP